MKRFIPIVALAAVLASPGLVLAQTAQCVSTRPVSIEARSKNVAGAFTGAVSRARKAAAAYCKSEARGSVAHVSEMQVDVSQDGRYFYAFGQAGHCCLKKTVQVLPAPAAATN